MSDNLPLEKQFREYRKKLGSELRFALSVAINDSLFAMRNAMTNNVDQSVEGGSTGFTKKAFFVSKKSSKKDLSGQIDTRDIQNKYLAKLIKGGVRKAGDHATSKKLGVFTPSRDAKRNKHGNVSRRYAKRKRSFLIKKNGQTYIFNRTGRKGKSKIHYLGKFQPTVYYKQNRNIDLLGSAEREGLQVFKQSMDEAVIDLQRFGYVRSSSKRRRDNEDQ